MTKYDDLLTKLRGALGQLPAGSRFPSVRQLMREHRVSQSTVDRALAVLKDEGLILPAIGSGTCTAERQKLSVYRILLFIHDYPAAWSNTLASLLTERLVKSGQRVRCIRYPYQEKPWRHLPRSGFDLVLVLPSYRDTSYFEELQRRAGVPLILLDEEPEGGLISTLGTDNRKGGCLAAEHLIGLGHHRLAVLSAEPDTSTTRARIQGFCQRSVELGCPAPRILDPRTPHGGNAMESAHRFLAQALLARDFTGLFVTSDPTALGALKAIHDQGLLIPRELSVIGFDGMPEAAFFYPALTTLQQDLSGWVDAIQHILRQGVTENIHCLIPPRLIQRDSTGPIQQTGGVRP